MPGAEAAEAPPASAPSSGPPALPPGCHWAWSGGEWVAEPIPTATDEEYDAMLKKLPASAWNILASLVDQGAFRPGQADDVQLIKGFICRITRHKRFQPMLQDAVRRRQGG